MSIDIRLSITLLKKKQKKSQYPLCLYATFISSVTMEWSGRIVIANVNRQITIMKIKKLFLFCSFRV